jgi:hypothetical protein
VSRWDGSTARFVVTKVDEGRQVRLFSSTVTLRLIMCGGSFDRAARGYRDNIIVYAAIVV